MLIYKDRVVAEWVDYNGHLRDAYYLLLFSLATDGLMDHIELDHPGRPERLAAASPDLRQGYSMFSLECHIHYLHEVRLGAEIEVQTRLLAHDAKRLHLYSSLHLAGQERAMAAAEQMLLHVDLAGPHAAPFQPEVLRRVQQLAREDAAWARPSHLGKAISLPLPRMKD